MWGLSSFIVIQSFGLLGYFVLLVSCSCRVWTNLVCFLTFPEFTCKSSGICSASPFLVLEKCWLNDSLISLEGPLFNKRTCILVSCGQGILIKQAVAFIEYYSCVCFLAGKDHVFKTFSCESLSCWLQLIYYCGLQLECVVFVTELYFIEPYIL